MSSPIVRQASSDSNEAPSQTISSPYPWSKREAAAFLGIAESTLNRMLPRIPHVKLGTSANAPVRFSPDELREWLASVHRGG